MRRSPAGPGRGSGGGDSAERGGRTLLVGPHLGRAGQARARLGPRARALAGRLLLALGLWDFGLRFLLLGTEDLVLGLARQELHELVGVDGLALEQDLRDPVERLPMLDQDVL